MKTYIGIGNKKVTVPEEVYEVLNNADNKGGFLTEDDLKVLQGYKNIKIDYISTEQKFDGEIKIYGLSTGDSGEFETIKVM